MDGGRWMDVFAMKCAIRQQLHKTVPIAEREKHLLDPSKKKKLNSLSNICRSLMDGWIDNWFN